MWHSCDGSFGTWPEPTTSFQPESAGRTLSQLQHDRLQTIERLGSMTMGGWPDFQGFLSIAFAARKTWIETKLSMPSAARVFLQVF